MRKRARPYEFDNMPESKRRRIDEIRVEQLDQLLPELKDLKNGIIPLTLYDAVLDRLREKEKELKVVHKWNENQVKETRESIVSMKKTLRCVKKDALLLQRKNKFQKRIQTHQTLSRCPFTFSQTPQSNPFWNDVFLIIFQYVGYMEELFEYRLVCKSAHEAVHHLPSIWIEKLFLIQKTPIHLTIDLSLGECMIHHYMRYLYVYLANRYPMIHKKRLIYHRFFALENGNNPFEHKMRAQEIIVCHILFPLLVHFKSLFLSADLIYGPYLLNTSRQKLFCHPLWKILPTRRLKSSKLTIPLDLNKQQVEMATIWNVNNKR